jgi:hypothetical protein
MFLALDKAAKYPSMPWATQNYDSGMAAMASESPATFLQISDQSRDLRDLIVKGRDSINEAAERSIKEATSSLNASLDSAKTTFRDSITTDTRNAILKATPIAAIAIVLLAIGQWLATHFLTDNVEFVAKQRADQIEAKIDKQLDNARTKPVFVYSGTEESKALLERMKALEVEIKRLEEKKR